MRSWRSERGVRARADRSGGWPAEASRHSRRAIVVESARPPFALCYPPAPMPLHDKKVVAVLPAYNAEKTLRATFDDIPQDWVDEILLVDDVSRDKTVGAARR